jgi:hypothetical protein
MIDAMAGSGNEVGTAPGRGRPAVPRADAEQLLEHLAGAAVNLPENAVVTGQPKSCPACGSTRLMWGCDPDQTREQAEIHPLVWHETEWMADTFICRDCQAGWIEPDDPAPITWVRPYWIVS